MSDSSVQHQLTSVLWPEHIKLTKTMTKTWLGVTHKLLKHKFCFCSS